MKSPAALFRAEQRFKDKMREVTLFFAVMKREPQISSKDPNEKRFARFIKRYKDNQELTIWITAMKLISTPIPGFVAKKITASLSRKETVKQKKKAVAKAGRVVAHRLG